MPNQSALSHLQPGALLRSLLGAAGLRRALDELGSNKDLDDLASEAQGRKRSPCELLQRIEDESFRAIAADCGDGWAQFLRKEWVMWRDNLQILAQEVDAIALSPLAGKRLLAAYFEVPGLVVFMQRALHASASWQLQPALELWWQSPLQAWVALASTHTGMSTATICDRLGTCLDVDTRTLQRWWAGEPLGRSKIGWPYEKTVSALLGQATIATDPALARQLAGWLLLACLFQSLPSARMLRKAAQRDGSRRQRLPRTFLALLTSLNRSGERRRQAQVAADELVPLHQAIEQAFTVVAGEEAGSRDARLRYLLARFEELLGRVPPSCLCGPHYLHWYRARHAALRCDDKTALVLYQRAIDAAWWRAGRLQQPLLVEALAFAAGTGNLAAAAAWWDKTFMLGLNRGRKRPLDAQQRRQLCIGFERLFHPRKASERIPPPFRIHGPEDGFTLLPEHLRHPNRKRACAEGGVRETPLMQAVREGTLDEVKQLLDAGGDADDYIPESGEGPLSVALRRAEQRRDPAILQHLLSLDLKTDTVNRAAGMQRHTPLRMAITTADAAVVARLLALGADVEQPCGGLPSALCHAMHLLAYSLDPEVLKQSMVEYLAGGGHAELHDARSGGMLDVDLASVRGKLATLLSAHPWRRNVFDAMLNLSLRPPADHRAVVAALMAGGADANRRYRARSHHLCEWTPTLYAAEIGDLPTFRLLVEHSGDNRGDPTQVLMPGTSVLERYDALWVAAKHQRSAIVGWLQQRHEHGATNSARKPVRNRRSQAR